MEACHSQGTLLSEEACLVASDECRQVKRDYGRTSSKEDQQTRYWSYLFDNLHRVVDEIYCTCEADRSVIECEVSSSCCSLMSIILFEGHVYSKV